MVLENDTRGWIMTAVSGIGKSQTDRKAFRVLTWSVSLLFWSQYNMYRYHRQAIPAYGRFLDH